MARNTVILTGSVEYQFIPRGSVTAFTPRKLMSTDQLEAIGQQGMIGEDSIRPYELRVTGLAVQREPILRVRQDRGVVIRILMAAGAIESIGEVQSTMIVVMTAFAGNDLVRSQ